jgi:hypothetical protein
MGADSSDPAADVEGPDPISGLALDALYASRIEPELVKAEAGRKKAMTLSGAFLFAGFAALLLEAAIAQAVSADGSFLPHPGIIAATVIVTIFMCARPLIAVAAEAKRAVAQALCIPLGVSYRLKGFTPPDPEPFRALHLLPDADDETYEDHFSGVRAGCDFELCEATYTIGSGKNRVLVFQGQIFRIRFPRRFLGRAVVLRQAGWLSNAECPAGMQKAGLEDPRFERAFDVFCTDQVEARAILTPDFMEQLTGLETRFASERVRCGFEDGHVLIALQGKNRFEMGSMFTTLVDRKRVEGMAGDLSAVFGLIDAFVGRGLAR